MADDAAVAYSLGVLERIIEEAEKANLINSDVARAHLQIIKDAFREYRESLYIYKDAVREVIAKTGVNKS